jgi:hypothetical protein
MRLLFVMLIIAAGTAGAADKAAAPAKDAPATESAAGPETAFGDYDTLDFEAGVAEGNLKTGVFDHMGDGVKLVLRSKDPAKKPMPINARDMKFTWSSEGGSRKPAHIVMEGDVSIVQDQGTVHAEKAEFDYEKGTATFSGNPVMTSEENPQGLHAEQIQLDFKSGKFKMIGGRAKEFPLKGMAGPGAADEGPSAQLRPEDVLDWAGFLTKIKGQVAGADASPGKRVIGLLDVKVQKMISGVPVETLLADKQAIVKQINRALSNPKMFDKAAWNGVQLDADTQALLAQANLPAKDAMRLNRRLLEAAYPGMVAPFKPAAGN